VEDLSEGWDSGGDGVVWCVQSKGEKCVQIDA